MFGPTKPTRPNCLWAGRGLSEFQAAKEICAKKTETTTNKDNANELYLDQITILTPGVRKK